MVEAVDDAYSTPAEALFQVGAPGVLGNDSDCGFQAALLTDVDHGSLTLNGDGSFDYIPGLFVGVATFEYYIDAPHPAGLRRNTGFRPAGLPANLVAVVTIEVVAPPPPVETSDPAVETTEPPVETTEPTPTTAPPPVTTAPPTTAPPATAPSANTLPATR